MLARCLRFSSPFNEAVWRASKTQSTDFASVIRPRMSEIQAEHVHALSRHFLPDLVGSASEISDLRAAAALAVYSDETIEGLRVKLAQSPDLKTLMDVQAILAADGAIYLNQNWASSIRGKLLREVTRQVWRAVRMAPIVGKKK